MKTRINPQGSTGDTKGNFIGFDARDGKVLLKKNLGDPIGGGVITYELGGVQYIAVAGGMKNTVTQHRHTTPSHSRPTAARVGCDLLPAQTVVGDWRDTGGWRQRAGVERRRYVRAG